MCASLMSVALDLHCVCHDAELELLFPSCISSGRGRAPRALKDDDLSALREDVNSVAGFATASGARAPSDTMPRIPLGVRAAGAARTSFSFFSLSLPSFLSGSGRATLASSAKRRIRAEEREIISESSALKQQRFAL